jgi:hypothetical protein
MRRAKRVTSPQFSSKWFLWRWTLKIRHLRHAELERGQARGSSTTETDPWFHQVFVWILCTRAALSMMWRYLYGMLSAICMFEISKLWWRQWRRRLNIPLCFSKNGMKKLLTILKPQVLGMSELNFKNKFWKISKLNTIIFRQMYIRSTMNHNYHKNLRENSLQINWSRWNIFFSIQQEKMSREVRT